MVFPMPAPSAAPPPMFALPEPEVPPPVPGPQDLPPWAQPKKPKLAHVLEQASRDRDWFQGYVGKVANMLAQLDPDRPGSIFSSDRDDDDMEVFTSPALIIEHNRFCAWGHNHDFVVHAPVDDAPLDSDEAADKEDAAYFWLDCWAKQHADAGWGNLKWALFDTMASYGRLATLVSCDFQDPSSGLTFRLLDPATTFPVFQGKRGLHHVSMIYVSSANDILDRIGDPTGKLERKLTKLIANEGDADLGLDTEGEVVEWLDRGYHLVSWNSTELKNEKHGYGFVPVRYDRGPGGRQGFTSPTAVGNLSVRETHNLGHPNGPTPTGFVSGGRFRSGTNRIDEAEIGLPFQYWKITPHKTMEALMSRNLTLAKWMTKPSVWVTQGLIAEREGAPDLHWKEGKPVLFNEHEKAEIPQVPFVPNVLQALMGQMTQDQAMGSAGQVAFGQAPPQTTGSAAGMLDAQGKEIWAPELHAVERHVTGVLEMAAILFRDWGELAGAPGSRGFIPIPRRNPRVGLSQAFDLTPEMLNRVGIRFNVEFHRFNAQTLSSLAAGLLQLVSANLISREDAIRIVGYTLNPRAAMQRIREDQLNDAPIIAQADQLRRLADDMVAAGARGDDDSAQDAEAKLRFVAEKMAQEEARNRLMMQSMALNQYDMMMKMTMAEAGVPPALLEGGAGPPEGVESPSPIPPGGVASLPEFGIEPGTDGGRPPMMPPEPPVPEGF